ncbi:NADP-dependent oxidoreductase domain-containing protein [Xylogone sp. PMI_703]|nr:NADP-dependent oxidoreductase domain-containing protein [Xylogone sp. PMI_703]
MPASYPTRKLGKTGPEVAAIGFGLMGLSGTYGQPQPDEVRFKVLDRAVEIGATFWDTADVYHDSEDFLGRWFKRTGKRNEIFLASKFAHVVNEKGEMSLRTDPEYVKEACAKSLKRLGVDTIDLYYAHRVDGRTPVELTIKAMVELKNEGKIKHLGLSEISAETLRRAHKVHPIAAVQVEYSPFAMEIEHPEIDLLRTCRELGVAVIAYSPLGRGLLTGAYRSPDDFDKDDFRRFIPRYSAENFPKNLELADTLQKIAEQKACTPGQLALAWLLSQGEDIIPIPGTSRIKNLEENMAAVNVKVTAAENEAVRKAIASADIQAERYPTQFLDYLFGNTPPLDS